MLIIKGIGDVAYNQTHKSPILFYISGNSNILKNITFFTEMNKIFFLYNGILYTEKAWMKQLESGENQ